MFEHSRSWKGSPTSSSATLEHQAPCWVTAGYPGTTFVLLQEILKDSASLLVCNRTNRRWDEMVPGCSCFSELTSRSAWDTPFFVNFPVKAEMLLNLSLSHTDGVKAVGYDISLCYLPAFSQSYFSYWCLGSGFIFDTRMCFLVCAQFVLPFRC